jgi:hypothetical protein
MKPEEKRSKKWTLKDDMYVIKLVFYTIQQEESSQDYDFCSPSFPGPASSSTASGESGVLLVKKSQAIE